MNPSSAGPTPATLAASERLDAALGTARMLLSSRPAQAVTGLVEVLAGQVLPAVEGPLRVEMGGLTEALTIVGLSKALDRGRRSEVQRVDRIIERLEGLLPQLRSLASTPTAGGPAGYFVAEPKRDPREAHVLRHHPRSVQVWPPDAAE